MLRNMRSSASKATASGLLVSSTGEKEVEKENNNEGGWSL